MPYAPCWPTRSASDGTYAASEIDVLDDFELDGSGYANHALAHDAAGNLTCDGVFLYTYDPWSHLTQVHRAYHDGSGADGDGDGDTADPERGSLVASFTYDGLGRRVSKAVTNMADLDATYYYYYDGDRCVEVRNGSHDPIKNYVWAPMPVAGDDASVGGPGYVDELVQIIHHLDTGSGAVQTFHWVLQDVNYNVLGVVQAAGAQVERYEYAPYGGREVYIQSGVNDGRVQSRIDMSRRIPDVVTLLDQPYGLCEIGHQGLMHDEELGLVHNRARTLHPRLRRFMQRDPAGYVDGMGLYVAYAARAAISVDPSGLLSYVPSVGLFSGTLDRGTGFAEAGFILAFDPLRAAFLNSAGACCEEIRFVQMYMWDGPWTGLKGLGTRRSWKLDVGGGGWYPYGRWGNPMNGDRSEMHDSPGFNSSFGAGSFWMAFETCAACSRGLLADDAVYGCIPWSFSFTVQKINGVKTVTNWALQVSDNAVWNRRQLVFQDIEPAPPSDQMKWFLTWLFW